MIDDFIHSSRKTENCKRLQKVKLKLTQAGEALKKGWTREKGQTYAITIYICPPAGSKDRLSTKDRLDTALSTQPLTGREKGAGTTTSS